MCVRKDIAKKLYLKKIKRNRRIWYMLRGMSKHSMTHTLLKIDLLFHTREESKGGQNSNLV